ncbi:hypothetical protein J6590_063132 [Homalodisca vitripennis]|nr:hypothetical protein J6590_063132 [Homalodisca vitripennis]
MTRIFWGCLFAVTSLLVSGYTCYLAHLMSRSSVEVIVDNPSYSLENIDFPAVTVCPNSKLMRSRVHNLLANVPTVPPVELPDGSLECLRNNAAGRGSGLSFELKSIEHEALKKSKKDKGYSIMVHDPSSYPEIPHKMNVFWKNWTHSRISVLPTTVKSDANLKHIMTPYRGCQMDSDISINTCFFKCRQDEILRRCGCLPYYTKENSGFVVKFSTSHIKLFLTLLSSD